MDFETSRLPAINVLGVDVTATASVCCLEVLFLVCCLVAQGQSHAVFVESILPDTEVERPVSEEENSSRYPAKGILASSTPKVKRRLINNLLMKLTGIRRKAILHSTYTFYNRQ